MKNERYEEELSKVSERVSRLEAKVDLLIDLFGGKSSAVSAEPEDRATGDARRMISSMSQKQNAVAQLICAGESTEAMAERLGVADSTIKVHIRGIMNHMDVRKRSEIVAAYHDAMVAVGGRDYERLTGIPADWAEHPDRYETVTESLRTKTR